MPNRCSSKRYRKVIISGVIVCVVISLLALWLSTRPSPSEQLIAMDKARAIPDDDNAALHYKRILKMPSSLEFPEDFGEPNDTLTLWYPWRTVDHPKIADWISARQPILNALQEASEFEQCVFPLPRGYGHSEVSFDREWTLLLKRAANNDLAEGRKLDAFKKMDTLSMMSLHAHQEPTGLAFLNSIALNVLLLHLQFSFITMGDARDEDLEYLKTTSRSLEPNLEQHFTNIAKVESLCESAFLDQEGVLFRLKWRMDSLFYEDFPNERVIELLHRNLADRRALHILIELRRFKNKTDHWPESLDQISASVTPVALKDPHNDLPFVYKPFGSSFVLYSVGPDGKDQNNKYREKYDYDDLPHWPRRKSKAYEKWQQAHNPEFYEKDFMD